MPTKNSSREAERNCVASAQRIGQRKGTPATESIPPLVPDRVVDTLKLMGCRAALDERARFVGLTVHAAFSTRQRSPRVTDVRRMVYLELRARGWSYPEIGKLCGMDHTSVRDAVLAKAGPVSGRPTVADEQAGLFAGLDLVAERVGAA